MGGDIEDTVRRYGKSVDARERQRLCVALEKRRGDALRAILDVHARGEIPDKEAVQLGAHLARGADGQTTDLLLRTLQESVHREAERLVALEILVRLRVGLTWPVLAQVAWDASDGLLRATCLRQCKATHLSMDNRAEVLWLLETSRAPAVIVAALALVEPLLGADSTEECRERTLDAICEQLQSPDREVRRAALELLNTHCQLDWLERVRFVAPACVDHEFLEGLHGVVSRIWTQPLDLMTVSPSGFEHLIKRWLRFRGYGAIHVRGGVKDDGIDLDCTRLDSDAPHASCAVQCKRWLPGESIGDGVVRKLLADAQKRDARYALFVTTSDFTGKACDLLRSEPRLGLVGGRELLLDFEKHWGPKSVVIHGRAASELPTLPFGTPGGPTGERTARGSAAHGSRRR